MRTIQQALEHAGQQKRYPLRDAPDLIPDFILLAEELARLRSYSCKHPVTEKPTAFVSAELVASNVFGPDRKFEDIPVVVDQDMGKWDGIHFPQPNGTCLRYMI